MVAKKTVQRLGFRTGEYVVYPAHGVGVIVSIEEQEVAGLKLELFVISFEQDKLTLRVPIAKIKSVGMRKLAEESLVKKALETVTGRARVKRTMWSRRAQEYEAKINSGDLIAISRSCAISTGRKIRRSVLLGAPALRAGDGSHEPRDRCRQQADADRSVQLIEKNLAKSPRRRPRPKTRTRGSRGLSLLQRDLKRRAGAKRPFFFSSAPRPCLLAHHHRIAR